MKKIYVIIGLLLSLTACNNWLDVELDNKVDDDKLFSTADGFKEALAGVYSQMSKSDMYGKNLTMEYIDLCGQYYNYGGVSQQYEKWKEFDYENSGVKNTIANFWNRMYRNIGQLNSILMWADKNGGVMTEEQRNQVRGEALGLRAYLHFDLYRMFCPDVKLSPKVEGIPYNKEFGVSLPPMYTVEEVLQLVITDLLEAEKCLENDPITTVIPYEIKTETEAGEIVDIAAKDEADKYVARMNLYAVKATLARVYQARGEYTKAIEKAQEVIDCGKFRMLDFASVDASETNVDLLFSDEHIFSLRNREIGSYSEQLHHNKEANGVSSRSPLPFENVAVLYEGNNDDVRYSKWFDIAEFMKFLPDSNNIYPRKMPLIKLSEMYLLQAECYYFKDKDKAMEAINTLRDHRIRGNKHWSTLRQSFIFDEMKREFIGEGQFWYAMKRNNLDLPSHGPSGGTMDASGDIYVFPLPDAEIEDGHRNERK